jgi:hypothetical protein
MMSDSHRSADEAAHITGAARFAVLPEAAEVLLEELSRRFLVEWREVKEPLADGSTVRWVRLIPRTPAAAPLAVAFTDTPGIVLQLGRWFRQSLPGSGDDIGLLQQMVTALVEGGLWERVRRGPVGSVAEAQLIGPDLRVGRQVPLDARGARQARREGFAAAVQWGPWPARP